jgi:hypothetical protein
VDSSPISRSWIAVRIPGFNSFIAADRIPFRSRCKQLSSGLGHESGKSSGSAGSSVIVSIGTSSEARFLRSHIRASFIAIRVSQVEKEEFPSNCRKCTNAF